MDTHKITINLAVISLLSTFSATASSNPAVNQSYIAVGGQHSKVSANGMQTYFGELYNNDVNKDLHGYYIDAKWHINQQFFVRVNHDYSSRVSTDLSQYFYAAGYNLAVTSNLHWFNAIGYANYKADRTTSSGGHRKNDNGGVALETGLTFAVTTWLQTQPSYRFADYPNGGQHQFNLNNQILFGQHSALELNLGYRDWHTLAETNYQIGYRYRF